MFKFDIVSSKPTEENITVVLIGVDEDREISIRRHFEQFNICYSTPWRILLVDLGLKAYKINFLQELKPHCLPQLIFGEWAL